MIASWLQGMVTSRYFEITFLIILFFVVFFLNNILFYFTKKSKMITVKEVIPTHRIQMGRRSITIAIRPSYVIGDNEGNRYIYKYRSQLVGIQKMDPSKIAALKPGDRIQITYYGLITPSIVEVNWTI